MAWAYATTILTLSDSYGVPVNNFTPYDPSMPAVATINGYENLDYTLVTNEVSSLTVTLLGYMDRNKLGVNYRIDVFDIYRDTNTGLDNPVRVADRSWFIQDIDYFKGGDDVQRTELIADSANVLLTFRDVGYTDNYNVSSNETYLNTPADDIMKKYVTGNFISPGAVLTNMTVDTGPGRVVSTYFQVAPLNGLAPRQTTHGAWRELKDFFIDICRTSELGNPPTPLFWDVVTIPHSTTGKPVLEFRTYVNTRGADRTQAGALLIFSDLAGDLVGERVKISYRNVVTFAWGLGKNDGRGRVINSSYDATAINANAFGRREKVVVDKKAATAAELKHLTDKAIRAGRPKATLTGKVLSRPGKQFGLDWNWGDKCLAKVAGFTFTVRIDVVNVKISGTGARSVTASLKAETYVI